MNDGSIRQLLENFFLLLEKLINLFALDERRLGNLDAVIVADVDYGLREQHQADVVDVDCVVSYVNVTYLHRTVKKKLKAHIQPVDIKQHDGHTQGQQVSSYEEIVHVILFQHLCLVVGNVRVDYCIGEIVRKLVETIGYPVNHVPCKLSLALLLLC
jgi:hypothetical protein